jgi:radical SAM protein with 4Fe4S-binding SPASM domain
MPKIGLWHQAQRSPRFFSGRLRLAPAQRYLDLTLTLDMAWSDTRDYEYSKLYYGTGAGLRGLLGRDFDESRVICFRVPRLGEPQHIRIALPEEALAARRVAFGIDPLPYCKGGRYRIDQMRLTDGLDDPEASRQADLMAHKQWVRNRVVAHEQGAGAQVGHQPESLCLEVTPRCNLTCGHCATHGTPEAHRSHNAMAEIRADWLDHLAETVFPGLTSVTTIGRGEPLYLAEPLWHRLIGHLKANHVLLSVVTNGVLVKKRITADLMPLMDTLTVSIDGLSQATFGTNRGNAHIDGILDNIRHFHELRRAAGLPRRPKLCLSWTLKRNNIGELLDFIEVAKEFEPDLLFTRHLMIFHEHDRAQSLLSDVDLANRYLEPVYRRLKELGIRHECPPLAAEDLPRSATPAAASAASPLPNRDGPADPCMFVYRTANIHTDGKIHVCPRPSSPLAGDLHQSRFSEIWFGPRYTGIRASLDSSNELPECRHCWYRESRYHPQRFDLDPGRRQRYSLLAPVRFTRKSWDFT